jgi:3-oxoacyl-[acyl-carrier-protein] synthase II
MSFTQRRVVITGMGLVSPLGNTKEALWDALAQGRSGVGPLGEALGWAAPMSAAAEVKQFTGDIDDFGPLEKEQKKAIRKGLKVMARESLMGVAAAQLTLADAGLGLGKCDPERTGISFGVDYMLSTADEFTEGVVQCLDEQGEFHFSRWGNQGMPKMSPLWLLKFLPNMPASHVAIYNDLRGPNNSLTLREAAANAALGEAFQIILRGGADAMLVGATGTRLHTMKIVHAMLQEELARGDGDGDPARLSRPFDLHRTGVVLGEGAAGVMLEELGAAQARGATIYGEVVAAATGLIAARRLVARRGPAIANVLRAVLQAAGAKPDQVGHLHAHGLSTRSCDIEEAQAIQSVFGGRANPLPVVAAKSYFGNLGAGGGMVELISSLMAMKDGHLFPTLNYQTPDPDCPLAVVADRATAAGDSFINVNVTPQGQASAVMVRRWGR